MAQLVARLVRNEKVGGSNPPSSTNLMQKGRGPRFVRGPSLFLFPLRARRECGCGLVWHMSAQQMGGLTAGLVQGVQGVLNQWGHLTRSTMLHLAV